jgi:hypothetical protein
MSGWIGVDLDGTLAEYSGWVNETHIGEPIPGMAFRVRRWLAEGKDVRIFTARVARQFSDQHRDRIESQYAEGVIREWCYQHLGRVLPVTCVKDMGMIELWDDRAVRVKANEGEPCCDHHSRDPRRA